MAQASSPKSARPASATRVYGDVRDSPDVHEPGGVRDIAEVRARFRTGDVVQIVGVSRRQLQYWAETDLVGPSGKTPGTLLLAEGGFITGFEAEVKNQESSADDLKRLLEVGNSIRGALVTDGKLRALVLASNQVTDEAIRLPEPRKLEPYITVADSPLLGQPIAETPAIVITGHGFDRERPVRVLVDAEPLQMDYTLEFDEEGRFTLRIPPAFELGGHTVLVEQETERGLLRDATTFHLTVQDFDTKEKQHKQ